MPQSPQEEVFRVVRTSTDPHRYVASIILQKPVEKVTLEERRQAKMLNFWLTYGPSETVEEPCKQLLDLVKLPQNH